MAQTPPPHVPTVCTALAPGRRVPARLGQTASCQVNRGKLLRARHGAAAGSQEPRSRGRCCGHALPMPQPAPLPPAPLQQSVTPPPPLGSRHGSHYPSCQPTGPWLWQCRRCWDRVGFGGGATARPPSTAVYCVWLPVAAGARLQVLAPLVTSSVLGCAWGPDSRGPSSAWGQAGLAAVGDGQCPVPRARGAAGGRGRAGCLSRHHPSGRVPPGWGGVPG